MNDSSKFIPNSFQMPNAYVDLAMQYLTGDEFKVLVYTVRHIMGWQHRVIARRAHISLSTYVSGYAGMGGTGLSRQKVVNALKELETYGFLKRVSEGAEYHKGTLWELSFTPNTTALETRTASKLDVNRTRTAKARKTKWAKRIGLTDNTSIDTQTDIGLSVNTDIGLSVNTQINTDSNPVSNTSFAPTDVDASQPAEKPSSKPKTPTPQQAMFEAICKAFKYDVERITKSEKGRIGKVAAELVSAGYAPLHVPIIYGHCTDSFDNFTVNALATSASDAMAAYKELTGIDPLREVLITDAPPETPTPETPPQTPPVADGVHYFDISEAWDNADKLIGGGG